MKKLCCLFLIITILLTGCATTSPKVEIEGYNYNQKFGYDVLTDVQKSIYDAMAKGLITKNKPFEISEDIKISDVYNVIDLYISQNSDDSWKETFKRYECNYVGDKLQVFLSKNVKDMPSEEQLEKERKLEEETKKILSLLPNETASDYEKVKAIALYLCDNITYNYDALNLGHSRAKRSDFTPERLEIIDEADNIYGALVYKECVCSGYGLAFTYLCNKLGVKSINVFGSYDTEDLFGAWNLVNVDGAWYHVNIKVMDLHDKGPNYDYFLVTDEQTKLDHSDFTLSTQLVSPRISDMFRLPSTPNENYERLINK